MTGFIKNKQTKKKHMPRDSVLGLDQAIIFVSGQDKT